MTRTNNFIVPALVLSAFLPLAAESTGRIAGKVTNKAGQPIAGARITVKRLDINWTKTFETDSKGNYFYAGLAPKEYDLTCVAEGYVNHLEKPKIPLAETLTLNIEMTRPGEFKGGAGQVAQPVDEGAKLENEGLNLFNENLELYQQGRFAEAMGPFETAYASLKNSLEKTTDEMAKAELKPKVELVERILGLTYYQVGKKDEAEPLLLKAIERKADDQNVIVGLVEIYAARKDAVNEAKYRAMLEKLTGPNPDITYNRAVEAFNAGKNKEARDQVDATLRINPKHAEAHYLLALLDLGDGHMAPARAALLKYLELAPNGKKVGEVKEILKGIPK